MLVKGTRHRDALRGDDTPDARRPFRVRNDHLVVGLEQRLADDVEPVDSPGRHHHFVGAANRYRVLLPQLLGEQLQQPWHTGRLKVVTAVLVDRQPHRVLDRVGRVETDVPLIETERILDGVHHVANANDARERHAVEKHTHSVDAIAFRLRHPQRKSPAPGA